MSEELDEPMMISINNSLPVGENTKVWIECIKEGKDILSAGALKVLTQLLEMEIDLCWMDTERVHTAAVLEYKKEKAAETTKIAETKVVNLDDKRSK